MGSTKTLNAALLLIGAVFPIATLGQYFNYTCVEEGRFADPNDCTGFVDCIYDTYTTSLRPRFETCRKGGFHPRLKKCVNKKKLKGCYSRRARLNQVRHDLQDLCTTGAEFVCADCNTMIHCLDGTPYSMDCSPSEACQEHEAFGGAVCYPSPQESCSCDTPLTFKKDPYNKSSFFFCNSNEEKIAYKCPSEMIFDEEAIQCVSPEGLPPCEKIGVFPHPENCMHYYTCIQTKQGWVQKLFPCPSMTMYNSETGMCEDPCTWNYEEFSCSQEGRFDDITDCSSFYECIKLQGTFIKTKRRCPLNYHWKQNPESNTGFCVDATSSTCEPIPLTSCKIPKDWCSVQVEEVNAVEQVNEPEQQMNEAEQTVENDETNEMQEMNEQVNETQPADQVPANEEQQNQELEQANAEVTPSELTMQPLEEDTASFNLENIEEQPFQSTVQEIPREAIADVLFSDMKTKLKELHMAKRVASNIVDSNKDSKTEKTLAKDYDSRFFVI